MRHFLLPVQKIEMKKKDEEVISKTSGKRNNMSQLEKKDFPQKHVDRNHNWYSKLMKKETISELQESEEKKSTNLIREVNQIEGKRNY